MHQAPRTFLKSGRSRSSRVFVSKVTPKKCFFFFSRNEEKFTPDDQSGGKKKTKQKSVAFRRFWCQGATVVPKMFQPNGCYGRGPPRIFLKSGRLRRSRVVVSMSPQKTMFFFFFKKNKSVMTSDGQPDKKKKVWHSKDFGLVAWTPTTPCTLLC